ncbi:hypothetical protein HZB78_01505 [Candidatus Collierbacteria bacterium]|nr:hypothetical protein [Candidatus Collierbacteria bacterium]
MDRLWLNVAMLTKQDFSKIKLLLKDHPTKQEIKKMLQDYPTREELYKHLDLFGKALSEKFNDSLKNYPTKDELFKRLDHIVGELETIRTEQLILTHSQTEYESRFKALEKIHPQGRHSSVPIAASIAA